MVSKKTTEEAFRAQEASRNQAVMTGLYYNNGSTLSTYVLPLDVVWKAY